MSSMFQNIKKLVPAFITSYDNSCFFFSFLNVSMTESTQKQKNGW